VKRRSRFILAVPTAVFLLVSTACGSADAPLDWLRPAGPIARDIGNLWTFVFWVAVAVFFLVEGAIVYAIFRFRERKGDTSMPTQTHGNTPLEIGWTILPALILAALAVPTLAGIWALAEERPNSMHVTVTGHQWWWQYNYEGEEWATANELHIPVDKPVYLGTCVEFCGLSHANMRARVIAHTAADFEKWKAEQRAVAAEPEGGLAAKGKLVFLGTQCVTCHTVRGAEAEIDGKTVVANGTTAPDLTHFASRNTFAGSIFERTDENLTAWVSDAPSEKPGSLMPAGLTEMGLTPDDVEAIVAYLQSLE
jgi:cytochrome c oxidase subunit II